MFTRMLTATVLAGTVAVIGTGAAHSATLSSGANAVSVRVGALGTVSADAVVGRSTGATPGGYDVSGGLATLNQSATLATVGGTTVFDRAGAGIVTSRATSNGTTAASGSVTLANPTLAFGSTTSVLGVPISLAALGLSASAITSQSNVALVNGALVGSGSASIADLALSGSLLSALNLNAALLSNPAANTVVFSLAGLTLTLNEQLRSGNGIDALAVQTNALHLGFDNYLFNGATLNGDIILGHSEASIAGAGAVPEPASWATMIAGFGLIGAALRRRRQEVRTVFA